MSTIYDIMKHNYQHRIKEQGVATLLHPLRNQGDDEPYAFALQYHQTDVVTAYPDGSVRLDSGGYSQPHLAWSNTTKTVSPTTRMRINRYLPGNCQIYQKQYKWYLDLPNGDTVEFIDGMILEAGMLIMPDDYSGMQVSYDYAV